MEQTFEQALASIRCNEVDIERLSDAFHATGNSYLGDLLHYIAGQLNAAHETIREHDNKIATERLKDAQTATANMMGGILAVARQKEHLTK